MSTDSTRNHKVHLLGSIIVFLFLLSGLTYCLSTNQNDSGQAEVPSLHESASLQSIEPNQTNSPTSTLDLATDIQQIDSTLETLQPNTIPTQTLSSPQRPTSTPNPLLAMFDESDVQTIFAGVQQADNFVFTLHLFQASKEIIVIDENLEVSSYRSQVSWSPDSRNIVFSAYDRSELYPTSTLYFFDLISQELTQLDLDQSGIQAALSPHWSPIENVVAFSGYPGPNIYIFDLVTQNFSILIEGHNPRFSPDGQKIAFQKESAKEPFPEFGNIYVIDVADPSSLTQITSTDTSVLAKWSPNGEYLAVLDELQGIFVIELDSLEVSEVTSIRYSFNWLNNEELVVAEGKDVAVQPAFGPFKNTDPKSRCFSDYWKDGFSFIEYVVLNPRIEALDFDCLHSTR